MEKTKKMLLVDPVNYERLQQQIKHSKPITNVLTEKVVDLDDKISEILQDNTISVADKATKYEQALHHFKRVKEEYLQKPIGKVEIINQKDQENLLQESQHTSHSNNDDFIISTLPPSLQRKGRLLLQHLIKDGNLTWNDQGVVTYKGKQISNANIIDLVNDFVRPRKRAPPEGYEVFAKALKKSNVANELIGNKNRQAYLKKHDFSPSSSSYSSSSSPPPSLPKPFSPFEEKPDEQDFFLTPQITTKRQRRRQQQQQDYQHQEQQRLFSHPPQPSRSPSPTFTPFTPHSSLPQGGARPRTYDNLHRSAFTPRNYREDTRQWLTNSPQWLDIKPNLPKKK